MMKKSMLFFASLFIFLGCQEAAEPADTEQALEAAPASTEQTAQAPAAVDRPDPENPGENLAVPSDWKVRLDRPNPDVVIGDNAEESDIFFVNMAPGWHITTGPAAIFYHPQSTAEGNYTATADIHLFEPGERREAFGLIIGGNNLDAENQTYDYFLIRNSKEYLIKRRTGNDTATIQDWTGSDAIIPYTENTEGPSVLNTLSVQVGAEDVAFMINDLEVTRVPRSEIQTDGLVGLRVNHALNLHVADFKVEFDN